MHFINNILFCIQTKMPFSLFLYSDYGRTQSNSVSPRGYGSNASTPHSANGSSYGTAAMNSGYGSPANLGNMAVPGSPGLFNGKLLVQTF